MSFFHSQDGRLYLEKNLKHEKFKSFGPDMMVALIICSNMGDDEEGREGGDKE